MGYFWEEVYALKKRTGRRRRREADGEEKKKTEAQEKQKQKQKRRRRRRGEKIKRSTKGGCRQDLSSAEAEEAGEAGANDF